MLQKIKTDIVIGHYATRRNFPMEFSAMTMQFLSKTLLYYGSRII